MTTDKDFSPFRWIIFLGCIAIGGLGFSLGAWYTKPTVVTRQILVTPTPSTTLANPASTNCMQQGGTLLIKKNAVGAEYGLCMFEDNYACEEWALFRGQCPKGGIRTTGFDTEAQKYCAWIGGQTYAVPNGVCTFSDGSSCPDDALFNGSCQQK